MTSAEQRCREWLEDLMVFSKQTGGYCPECEEVLPEHEATCDLWRFVSEGVVPCNK